MSSPVGIVALRELARGQRQAGIGRAPAPGARRRSRRAAQNARENTKSPVAVAAARPPGREHRGRPAAQGGTVDDVVVDQRRHVDQLDRGGGAHRAPRPRSPPAHSRTSSGRRRLPPAASVPAAASASTSPWPARDLLETTLGAFHQRGHPRPRRAARRRRPRSRACGRRHARRNGSRRCRPARITYRTSRRPARVHQLRELVARAESGAPSWAGTCRPRGRRRAVPSSGTMRSNQTEKNHFRGGRCGVVISRITTLPPGRTTRAISAIARSKVDDVANTEAHRGRVEVAVRERQLERVALHPFDRGAGRGRLALRQLEHRSGEVEADHAPRGTDPPSQLEREVARAAADVERRRAGADLRRVHGPGAPAMVQPRRHDRVHHVVAPRDPVEHRADLSLVCHTRGRGAAHRLGPSR